MPLPTVKLARQTVELYPDMQVADEIAAAERALEQALDAEKAETEKPGQTVASRARSAAKKAAEAAKAELDETRERAKSSVLEVVIDQMPKKGWREFEAVHPPREGDKTDEQWTIQWDEFVGAYLSQTSPTVRWQGSGEVLEVAADEWPAWVETVADPEYQKLGFAILALNRSKGAARPF